MSAFSEISYERRCEILGAIMLGLTALLFLALVTDGYQGRIERPIDGIPGEQHVLGPIGAFVAKYLVILLGGASHVIYLLMGVWGGLLIQHKPLDRVLTRMSGMLVLTFGVATLVHLNMGRLLGGLIGGTFGEFFLRHLGTIGANVIALTLCTVGVLLATDFLFVQLLAKGKAALLATARGLAVVISFLFSPLRSRRTRKEVRSREAAGGKRLTGEREREPQPGVLVPANLGIDEGPLSAYSEAERSLPNIRINEARTAAAEDDLPFDDVPRADDALDDSPAEETAALPGPGGYPGDSVFDDDAGAAVPFDEVPAQAGSGVDCPSAFDGFEDAEPAETMGTQTEMDLAPSSAKAAKSRRPALRRKGSTEEELPPDYEYPQRYTKPSIRLFDEPPEPGPRDTSETLIKMSGRLEETLLTFGIEARVTDVTRGPTITRFELEPSPGIKVSRFLALADDIALALKAHRVRVEAPIPGKGRVGVEVPNTVREPVVVRGLLESKTFRRSKTILPLALGKDIAGEVTVVDLAAMPHCLVAGATGAGKTVCVKSLLASLLYAKTPQELQLMLIDPKMVELSIFDDIPHLITPVVTDPKKAAASLNWLIAEMEERYRLFAHLRVRNIEVYNASVENGEIELVGGEAGEAEAAAQEGSSVAAIRKLPYIVCMIDELADLMMIARAEVEDAIARLAQLARAVGIHLILATQRPSVDVLTGVIKANFPARISFQVSSRVDSRCILDVIGAERLIGQGDMLYLPAGQSKPARLQGAFVSDPEMEALIAYLKTQAPPQYRDEIENFGRSREQVEELDEQDDAMFDDAVRVVLETGQASISMVQRRLRVGYTRAARLVDMMELRGIVGPHIGSKAREILVDVPPKNEVA